MTTYFKTILMLILMMLIGCASPSEHESKPVASPAPILQAGQIPKTLGILPFENNSITDPDNYAPLSKGLAAILTTDLKKNAPALRLIERSKIKAILDETMLSQSGGVNESAAIRTGKILGAEAISLGSFIVIGKKVRIDVRIIGTESSHVIMAESISGVTNNFMEMVQLLGQKIASSLNVAFHTSSSYAQSDIDAAIYFSRGLDAQDRGDHAAAKQFFEKSINIDPSYKTQIEHAQIPEASEAAGKEQIQIVEVEGLSGLSKDDAIRHALRKAIEQGAGVFIHSRTEVENFEVVKDRILSQTEGYIKRFDILEESQELETFKVKIKALVSLNKIKDDLKAMKILLDTMDRPMLMILVEEAYLGMDNLGMKIAETELTSLLAQKGFDLVDKSQLEEIKNIAQQKQALAGNLKAAQSLAFTMGAQYVILGKATVQSIDVVSGSKIRSAQASLQLKILQTQTGLILGSVVKNNRNLHGSALTGATNALRSCAESAVNEWAMDAITTSFQDFINNGAPLKLTLSNVNNFDQYHQVSDTIKDIDRVVSSKTENWNQAGGLLTIGLRYKGTSEELAKMLDGLVIGSFMMEVVDLAPDSVDCSLKLSSSE